MAICLNGGAKAQYDSLCIHRRQEDIIDTARLKKICASLAGASSTLYGPPSNILVYAVGDKKFAYFKTSEPEKWRFSLRVSPDRFVELTDVPGINLDSPVNPTPTSSAQ